MKTILIASLMALATEVAANAKTSGSRGGSTSTSKSSGGTSSGGTSKTSGGTTKTSGGTSKTSSSTSKTSSQAKTNKNGKRTYEKSADVKNVKQARKVVMNSKFKKLRTKKTKRTKRFFGTEGPEAMRWMSMVRGYEGMDGVGDYRTAYLMDTRSKYAPTVCMMHWNLTGVQNPGELNVNQALMGRYCLAATVIDNAMFKYFNWSTIEAKNMTDMNQVQYLRWQSKTMNDTAMYGGLLDFYIADEPANPVVNSTDGTLNPNAGMYNLQLSYKGSESKNVTLTQIVTSDKAPMFNAEWNSISFGDNVLALSWAKENMTVAVTNATDSDLMMMNPWYRMGPYKTKIDVTYSVMKPEQTQAAAMQQAMTDGSMIDNNPNFQVEPQAMGQEDDRPEDEPDESGALRNGAFGFAYGVLVAACVAFV